MFAFTRCLGIIIQPKPACKKHGVDTLLCCWFRWINTTVVSNPRGGSEGNCGKIPTVQLDFWIMSSPPSLNQYHHRIWWTRNMFRKSFVSMAPHLLYHHYPSLQTPEWPIWLCSIGLESQGAAGGHDWWWTTQLNQSSKTPSKCQMKIQIGPADTYCRTWWGTVAYPIL